MTCVQWPLPAMARVQRKHPDCLNPQPRALRGSDLLLNQELTSPSLCSRLLLKEMCSFFILLSFVYKWFAYMCFRLHGGV